MAIDEIRAAVIAALREIQKLSGRAWTELDNGLKPIGTLEGFDSVAGIEATIVLEEHLGKKLDIETLFADESRAFTISEICDQVAKLLMNQEAA